MNKHITERGNAMSGRMKCAGLTRDGYACSKRHTVERDGVLYCGMHDPVAKKAKRDARDARWSREADERRASFAEANAKAERARICVEAMAGINDPVAWMAEIEDVLTRLADYMDRHSDVVDGDYGEPEANKEMLLLSAIEPLLSRMGGENETEIR